MNKLNQFGHFDASFRAAGGEAGIYKLCNQFYWYMDHEKKAEVIRSWHREELNIMVDRLTAFVCGWLGGPRRYAERFGSINIPRFHSQFPIDEEARDAWIHCMDLAIDDQPYSLEFKAYLKAQFRIPAERCRSR